MRPARTVRLKLSTAVNSPKRFVTPSSLSVGCCSLTLFVFRNVDKGRELIRPLVRKVSRSFFQLRQRFSSHLPPPLRGNISSPLPQSGSGQGFSAMIPRRLFRPRLAAAFFAAICLLASAHAQQPDAPAPPIKDDEEVVRISTELVQTDVMVFDGSGKFVDGLKPEQFELRVDGKPQQVVFFERIQAGTVNEDAQIAAARGGGYGPTAGGAAVPLDRGRTVVFFVDDLHPSPSSAIHIRKTIQRFIDEEIGQNDEAVVVSASGQVGFLSQLTDNKRSEEHTSELQSHCYIS